MTDCAMPEMDGYTLTKTIREQEGDTEQRLPIIGVSAHAQQEEIDKCLALGMDAYVTKPVELSTLKETLEAWLPSLPLSARTNKSPQHAPSTQKALREKSDLPAASTNAPTSAEGSIPIDNEALIQFLGDNKEIHRNFLSMFISQNASANDALLKELEEKNFGELASLTHKLKSSSKAIGALELHRSCVELERAAKAREPEECSKFINIFHHEFARLEAYIKEHY